MSQAGTVGAQGGAQDNNVIFTRFTIDGTWTKNANTKIVEIFMWGGGSGGGSGQRDIAANTPGGGGGGAGAGFVHWKAPAFHFAASETVTIGVGGTGGAAQTVDSSSGNDGNPGTQSSIGNLFTPSANGTSNGTYGIGGGNPSAVGGTSWTLDQTAVSQLSTGAVEGGGAAGQPAVDVYEIVATGSSITGGNVTLGGGGGGGIDNIPTAFDGASGSNTLTLAQPVQATILAGGTAGTVGAGQNGGNGLNMSTIVSGGLFIGGAGGGGGASSIIGAAGHGGNGGIPGGGGGGGGASLNGNDSGAGGNGARGEVWIYEYI